MTYYHTSPLSEVVFVGWWLALAFVLFVVADAVIRLLRWLLRRGKCSRPTRSSN